MLPGDVAEGVPGRGGGFWERARRALGSRRAPWIILVIALLLHLPSLWTGWFADDHILRVRLDGIVSSEPPKYDLYPPNLADLFVFATGEPSYTHRLMERGFLSWENDPSFKVAFFRPLSAVTHLVDYLVAPDSAGLAHLHSLLWLALLLVAVYRLYRLVHGPTWVAGLAFLLYALDDARAPAVAWISNRNAIIAALLGALALIAHIRARRDQWRPGIWLGPLLFVASLAASEGGAATLAFLLAYAVTLDRGSRRQRYLALVPFVVLMLAWAVTYGALGYGVHGTDLYVDPLGEPLRFATTAVGQIPVLIASQISGVWSDFYLLLTGTPEIVAAIAAALYLLFFLDVVLVTLRASPEARFWALGMAVATVPTAGAFPTDRLLTFVALGGMGLIACFFHAPEGAPGVVANERFRRFKVRFWTIGLVVAHLVAAPLLTPYRSFANGLGGAWFARGQAAMSRDPEIEKQTVIAVNPPSSLMVSYSAVIRASLKQPIPAYVRWLAGGSSEVTVTREDERTLRVHPGLAYMSEKGARLLKKDAFTRGQRIALTGVAIEVTDLDAAGHPTETLWHFERPLEDPSYVWLVWSDDQTTFVPFTLPAIGQRVTLPAADVIRSLQGK